MHVLFRGPAIIVWLLGTAASLPDAAVNARSSSSAPDTCILAAGASEPLTLSDGRTIYVNIQSVAPNGADAAIFGSPSYTWARGATNHTNPNAADSLIGVVLDPAGRQRIIPNPLPGRLALDPRAVSAGARGWHVLFVDRPNDPSVAEPVTVDSAALWYGRFDGRAWRDLERVTVVRSAKIAFGLSSGLSADGNDVGFAYVFDVPFADRPSPDRNDYHGVVFIRGHPGQWRHDTLHTTLGPNFVSVARSPRPHSWYVAIVQPYLDEKLRVRPSSLFVTTFDSAWHTPMLAAGEPERPLRAPAVSALASGALVTWRAENPSRREWLMLAADGTTVRRAPAPFALDATESEVVRAGSETFVFARGYGARDRHQVFRLRDGVLDPVGDLEAANDVYGWAVVARSSSDLSLLASRVATADAEPPASTLLTPFRIDCSARR